MKTISQAKIHDGNAFSFYPNALGRIPFPSSIHPGDDGGKRSKKNWQIHKQNHIARAQINQSRSSNKSNPNFHGIGRHAGVKTGY